MKAVRKKNPVAFDLVLFLVFTITSFAVFVLTDAGGSTGAIIGISLLALTCLALITSR